MNQATDTETGVDAHGELRDRIIEESMKILAEHGPEALSLRRIAEASGTSTQMLYTIFGGKDALLETVYEAGSLRLVERFENVPEKLSPLERLYELGQQYREYALENRGLYETLYSSRLAEDEIVKKTDVYDVFREAIRDCFEEGLLKIGDLDRITEAFWAAAHGAIGLEISGYYDTDEEAGRAYDEVIRAVFDGYRVDSPTTID
jgi:AcrR family transcriptional regulator